MNTALVIMAAGIGSRYKGGIKQLEAVGANGEIIMDYSIHDAIEAGFRKIIFIIRKEIEADFREVIGNRIEKICREHQVEVAYAFQNPLDLPQGVVFPEGRTKPWGTGQAVLACKELIQEPFAVINADDYYGKEAFVKIHEFLLGYQKDRTHALCMAGFILKNTLSENGGVTRGICKLDANGYLLSIHETPNIVKENQKAVVEENGSRRELDLNSYVSMNMWGLTPEFVGELEKGFVDFFSHISGNELKAEYLLPIFIDELLQNQKISVEVLETKDKWFGVTYQEDKPFVTKAIQKLTEDGVYQTELFSDL